MDRSNRTRRICVAVFMAALSIPMVGVGDAIAAVGGGCSSSGGGGAGFVAEAASLKMEQSGSAADAGCSTFDSANQAECGPWVTWQGEVSIEGSSGSATGEMGCVDGQTVTCTVDTDGDVACTINEDDGDDDLICDIWPEEEGDFTAEIVCEDPITLQYVQETVTVEGGEIVDKTQIYGMHIR